MPETHCLTTERQLIIELNLPEVSITALIRMRAKKKQGSAKSEIAQKAYNKVMEILRRCCQLVSRRVVVILPNNLMEAVDNMANQRDKSRSAFIREALQHFMEECRLEEMTERMARGYQLMGSLNIKLSEEGLDDEAREMEEYLERLIVGEIRC